MTSLHITGDAAADELLSSDAFALLVGGFVAIKWLL